LSDNHDEANVQLERLLSELKEEMANVESEISLQLDKLSADSINAMHEQGGVFLLKVNELLKDVARDISLLVYNTGDEAKLIFEQLVSNFRDEMLPEVSCLLSSQVQKYEI
jgi:division protein CdvB (Snf7/Vps24/ESCRT-III family)